MVIKKITKSEKEQLRDEIEQLRFQYNLKIDFTNHINTTLLPILTFFLGILFSVNEVGKAIPYALFSLFIIFAVTKLWGRLDKSKNTLKDKIEEKYKLLTGLAIIGKDKF
jgi:putative Mn2+ efflux pump MntP